MATADLRSELVKLFGKRNDVIIEDVENIVYERFSSGSLQLDRNLKGGFVKGSVIEIFGDTGSGKTTLCIHAIAEHQKKYPDEPILWIDLERSFDPAYFRHIGIDLSPDKFIMIRPTAGEDAWTAIISMCKNIKVGAIVLDSVSCLINEREFEGDMGDAVMAGAARMNSQGFRKMMPFIKFGGVTLFAINQIRESLGVSMGDNTVTTGGRAWRFFSRTRIRATVSKGLDEKYGIHKYKLIKATYGLKDSVAETSIYYTKGISKERELIDLAVEYNIIRKSGSWYYYNDNSLGQGKDAVVSLFEDNLELVETIEKELRLAFIPKAINDTLAEEELNIDEILKEDDY